MAQETRRRPSDEGPKLYRRGRYWSADLRPWDAGRTTLRDPSNPRWPDGGERTESERVARRWAEAYVDHLEENQTRKQLGRRPKAETLAICRDRYLRHRSQHVEYATYRNDITAISRLAEKVGERIRMDEITPEILQEMVDEDLAAGYKSSTVRTQMGRLRVFLGESGGWNPAADLVLPARLKPDGKPWSDVELVRLRHAADALDAPSTDRRRRSCSVRLALELALATGGRERELFALLWTDINRRTGTVRFERQQKQASVDTKLLKDKDARTTLVLPEWWPYHRSPAVGIILANRFGRPLDRHAQDRLITRLLDSAGLNETGVAWHRFRHTYSRLFLERGGSLEELRKMLGHSSIRTTDDYYGHLSEDAAIASARRRIYGS